MFLSSLPWKLNLRTCNTTMTYIKETDNHCHGNQKASEILEVFSCENLKITTLYFHFYSK